MTPKPCKHARMIQQLTALSNSRYHRGATLAEMASPASLADEFKKDCQKECGDNSPYQAGADAS